MCFSVSLTRESFERDPRFHYLLEDFTGEFPAERGFHYFGFQHPVLPVLTTADPERAFPASWGLIPSWAAEPEKAMSLRSKTLNARGETLGEKPSFRGSWPKMRCLIPVEGFYEPHKEDSGTIPWYITRKDRNLFFLGGIYQKTPPALSGLPPRTFSILTVPSRDLLAEVHNGKPRMPLILASQSEARWLDPDEPFPDPLDSVWQLDQSDLEAWPVDTRLFNSRRDDPQVRERAGNLRQGQLFS